MVGHDVAGFYYVEPSETHETIRIVRGHNGYFTLPEHYKNVPAQKLNDDFGITETEANVMLQGSRYGWEREKLESLLKKKRRFFFGEKSVNFQRSKVLILWGKNGAEMGQKRERQSIKMNDKNEKTLENQGFLIRNRVR